LHFPPLFIAQLELRCRFRHSVNPTVQTTFEELYPIEINNKGSINVSATFAKFLEDFGGFWRKVQRSGGFWRILEDFGAKCNEVEDFGEKRNEVEDFGAKCNEMLTKYTPKACGNQLRVRIAVFAGRFLRISSISSEQILRA
jgi:hypothetical protein